MLLLYLQEVAAVKRVRPAIESWMRKNWRTIMVLKNRTVRQHGSVEGYARCKTRDGAAVGFKRLASVEMTSAAVALAAFVSRCRFAVGASLGISGVTGRRSKPRRRGEHQGLPLAAGFSFLLGTAQFYNRLRRYPRAAPHRSARQASAMQEIQAKGMVNLLQLSLPQYSIG